MAFIKRKKEADYKPVAKEVADFLLNTYLTNGNVFSRMSSVVRPEYFDGEQRAAVSFANKFADKYKALPAATMVSAVSGVQLPSAEQIQENTGLAIKKVGVCGVANEDWVCDELERLCRDQAFMNAATRIAVATSQGDKNVDKFRELLDEAAMVGRPQDVGMFALKEVDDHMAQCSVSDIRYSVGVREFDEIMNGGLAKKETILVTANSGKRKSITMANFCVNMLRLHKGLKVVLYTFEMDEIAVFRRIVSMLCGVSQRELYGDHGRMRAAKLLKDIGIAPDALLIKRMVADVSSVRDMRAHLQQVAISDEWKPDVICADYLDIIAASDPQSLQGKNVFDKDKVVATEFRNLVFDYNAMGITASQQGRGAFESEEIGQNHIQGGISKINTIEWVFGGRISDQHDQVNQMEFFLLKGRNTGSNKKRFLVGWDPVWLRLVDLPPERTKGSRPSLSSMGAPEAQPKPIAPAQPSVKMVAPSGDDEDDMDLDKLLG
jgi:hypothetical protein